MHWQQAWQRLSPPSSLLKLLPDDAAVVGAAHIIWWLAAPEKTLKLLPDDAVVGAACMIWWLANTPEAPQA